MTRFLAIRPLRGKVKGGGTIDLKIGCEVFGRPDGLYETSHHSMTVVSVLLAVVTGSRQTVVFALNPHIAATDLEKA